MITNVGGVASWGGFVPFRPSRQNHRHEGTSMLICKIKDCDNKHYVKGYCNKHYTRFWRHGDPFHVKNKRHGMFGTSEYGTWQNMKDRCNNKNNTNYKNYGGRGIVVCDKWENSFIVFFADMGLKPFPKAEIDRIDNDLGYYPENCRWATHTQNNQHQSTTKLTMEKAKEIRRRSGIITRKKLASIYGVCQSTINCIINQEIWRE